MESQNENSKKNEGDKMIDYNELKKLLINKKIDEIDIGTDNDIINRIIFKDRSYLELGGYDGCCVVLEYVNDYGFVRD